MAQLSIPTLTKLRQLDRLALCCAGYARTEQKMLVKFRSSSVIYVYSHVSEQMWQAFQKANSRGSWVALNLVAQPLKHVVTKITLPYLLKIEFDLECPQLPPPTKSATQQLESVLPFTTTPTEISGGQGRHTPAWYDYREKFGAKLAYRVVGATPTECRRLPQTKLEVAGATSTSSPLVLN